MITTIKVGSGILEDNGSVNIGLIETLGSEISKRMLVTKERFVIVSSGALLLGTMKLGIRQVPKDIKKRQAICAVGQPELMKIWSETFAKYGLNVSQILITHDDVELPAKARNIEDTITEIFKVKAIPIVNENDTVSTEEMRFGDNDFLSAYISVLVGARMLVIISDVDGVINKEGNVIKEIHPQEIERIWERIDQRRTKKRVSAGGITSKLTASKIAAEFGIDCYIINGRKPENIKLVLEGENPGTRIIPHKRYRKKELWMLKVMKGKGRVHIDSGAYKALKSGKSLLSAGIIDVEGVFSAGDMIEVFYEGNPIGRGISNYFSSEIRLTKGKKTKEIEAILGYPKTEEVIHRDNFVELE